MEINRPIINSLEVGMLIDLFKDELLCLDIRDRVFRFVLAKYNRKMQSIDVLKFGTFIIPEDCVDQGVICENETTLQAITNFIIKEKIKTKNVYMNISSPPIVLRIVKLPHMQEKDLSIFLQEEISQFIPVDSNSSVIDYKILDYFEEDGKKQMNVMLIAAPKQMIGKYVNLLKRTGLNPVVVDLYPNCIARVFSKIQNKNIAVLDVNSNALDFIILKNNNLFMHSNIYIDNSPDFLKLEDRKAEDIVNEDKIFERALGEITNYVKTYLNFFSSRHFGASVDRLYIIGELALIRDIDAYIGSYLQIEVKSGISDIVKVELTTGLKSTGDMRNYAKIALYACGLGLAMRGD